MIAKHVGLSTASVQRTLEKIKAKWECEDLYFTVVFQTVAYYRWVVSGRQAKNGMNSCSVYIANSYKS
jgi:hypothetical protein